MAYLTSWRLALAADLLREPDTTIGAVAEQVGYASSFALSTAFKRVRGISPREHRVRVGLLRSVPQPPGHLVRHGFVRQPHQEPESAGQADHGDRARLTAAYPPVAGAAPG
jgi:AraC-like DNA-binding protein